MNIHSIALIGYRGAGKTTVAAELARRLGWDWIDADVEIERRAGKSIAAIFADSGEPAFRELEAAVVADLSRRDRAVLALGGGAVLRDDNRQAIRGCGAVATRVRCCKRLRLRRPRTTRRPSPSLVHVWPHRRSPIAM